MKSSIAKLGGLLLACCFVMPSFAAQTDDTIQITDAYVRAVPAMMQNSAMFMTIKNAGDADRALTGASSDAAEHLELHTHTMDNGMMRMRQVPQVDLPAGSTVAFEPGGLHVMLLGLTHPLKPGENLDVKLTFDDGSSTTVSAPVKAPDESLPGGSHH